MSEFVIITMSSADDNNPALLPRGFGTAIHKTIATGIDEQLKRLADNVGTVIAAVGDEITSYGLDTIEVAVAVDAKGIFGIASAGMNASFKLTFGRRSEKAA